MGVWEQSCASRSLVSGLASSTCPRISDDDREFARRIANVLRQLRKRTGWSQDEAAERLAVPTGTLGRWERGQFAPKGVDLGKLYLAYKPFGAEMEWFLLPPEVEEFNPVRDHLDALARSASRAADEAAERAEARRRTGGGSPAPARERRTA